MPDETDNQIQALIQDTEQLHYANDLNYNALKSEAATKEDKDEIEASIKRNNEKIEENRKAIDTLLDLPF